MSPATAAARDAALLLTANRRGIASMSAAMACFIVNDALVKYASQSMPAAQLIFVRGLMASTLVLVVAYAMGASLRMRDAVRAPVIARAGIDAVGTMLYLVSLFHLPIANAAAIMLAAPLFVAVFAAWFLNEQVGLRRWYAILAGFAGVLLVVQPRSAGFNVYALLCLLATVLYATRDLITRRIGSDVSSASITLATAVVITLLSGAASLLEGWRAFGLFELALLAGASLFLAAAYYLLVDSMRSAEMSVVSPFRYSGILFALVIGFVVWGDVPNALAWCGIVLVLAAGLYLLHTEHERARRIDTAPLDRGGAA